jgi:hypothetical protein
MTERRDAEHRDLLTKLTDLCVQRYFKLRASSVFAGPTGRAVYGWVCGRSLAEIVGSNSTGGIGAFLL